MKQFLETRPTAEVAGVEYLAKAMVQWPAFAEGHTCRPTTTRPPSSAVDAGIEYRAKASLRQWPELLTWRCAT